MLQQLAMEQSPDPRNDEDYDTFLYGTEPIPWDTCWKQKKEEENDGGRAKAL
jgi:hypothetical protein